MTIRTVQQLIMTDGTVYDLPPIHYSNGWYLRPDQARTASEISRNTNRSFGRASGDGTRNAEEWYRSYLADINRKIDERGQRIAKLGKTYTSEYPRSGHRNDQIYAQYDDPTWGSTVVGVNIHPSDVYGDFSVTTFVQAHVLAFEPLTFENLNPQNAHVETVDKKIGPKDLIYSVTETFLEDPYAVLRQFPQFTPPTEKPEKSDGNNRLAYVNHGKMWADRMTPTRVFTEKSASLASLIGLYNFLGVKVEVVYAYTRNAPFNDKDGVEKEVESITVTIPSKASPDNPNNELGHTITFNRNEARIECGFVKDEVRWADYEKRKAENFLAEFQELVTPEEPTYDEYTITINKEET